LVTAGRSLTPSTEHAATLLGNGKVLITGGSNLQNALDSTELFNPKTGEFSAGPRLQRSRAGHNATLLADGRVLIAGGQGEDSAELFDPATNRSILVNGKLTAARGGHGTARLNDGRVLLAGGVAAVQSLVFGDFDGDGKADLSVWRGQSGDWLTVASGDGQLKTEAWGTSRAPYRDVPVAPDFDGDGKTDVAIWRASEGRWYAQMSRDASVLTRIHGQSGDLPALGKLRP
jgi:hypothetical protein